MGCNGRVETYGGLKGDKVARDVTVVAPIASFTGARSTPALTPEDEATLLRADNVLLRQQLEELRVTASTIANVALSLAKMHRETSGATVLVIPRELSERLMGAGITVGETAQGDIVVQIRERTVFPVEYE
jgi:hypothetical protein